MKVSVHAKNPVTRGVSHGVDGARGQKLGGQTPHSLPKFDNGVRLRLVDTRNVVNVGVRTIASRGRQPHFYGCSDGLYENNRTFHTKVRSVYDYIAHFFTSLSMSSRYSVSQPMEIPYRLPVSMSSHSYTKVLCHSSHATHDLSTAQAHK